MQRRGFLKAMVAAAAGLLAVTPRLEDMPGQLQSCPSQGFVRPVYLTRGQIVGGHDPDGNRRVIELTISS